MGVALPRGSVAVGSECRSPVQSSVLVVLVGAAAAVAACIVAVVVGCS